MARVVSDGDGATEQPPAGGRCSSTGRRPAWRATRRRMRRSGRSVESAVRASEYYEYARTRTRSAHACDGCQTGPRSARRSTGDVRWNPRRAHADPEPGSGCWSPGGAETIPSAWARASDRRLSRRSSDGRGPAGVVDREEARACRIRVCGRVYSSTAQWFSPRGSSGRTRRTQGSRLAPTDGPNDGSRTV